MNKHKTLRHAIPAKIKLMSLSEENCWDMFCFRDSDKMTEFVNCVVSDEDGYKTAFLKKIDLDKKDITVYITKNNWDIYGTSKNISRDLVFFCYFEIDEGTHKKNIWNIDALNNCVDLIGTNKRTYFDKVESQGTSFSYEQPYFVYYHQPILKNKKLDIRKKYADVLWLNIEIDELDDELFVAIQKMAIEKYGVIFKTLHSEGPVPCKIVEEIPVELYDAKLNFSNRISFQIEQTYLRKIPFILMLAGGYRDSFLSQFHMKTINRRAESVEEADVLLKEFITYSRIVPKLNSPWSFH